VTGSARRVKGNFRTPVRIWLCVETVIAYTFASSGLTRAAAGRARVEAYYGKPPNVVGELPAGQLFEVRVDDGWVRSDHPVAALLFAGLEAKASARGWNFAAGCGWFMAGSTPYDGVLALPYDPPVVADSHQSDTSRQPARLIERARRWHRCAEGLAPADKLFDTPTADLTIHGEPDSSYPADLAYLETLPVAKKQEAFGNYLRHRLTPAAGPSATARQAVAEQIDRVLQEAVANGHEDATMLDYFYRVEPFRRRGPFRTQSQLCRLADAVDRDEIEQLISDVPGFEARALSTLWAASALGVSSAAAEATLRQALWRATFDDHLEDINK
jgi:hypothetical protein